jgi:hypothetical protein
MLRNLHRLIALLLLPLAASADEPALEPLAGRLGNLSIHVRSFEPFNQVFAFLTEKLRLPIAYGEPWTSASTRRRMYAGLLTGNVTIEPCGPYDEPERRYSKPASALFYGLTFRPAVSGERTLELLAARQIPHTRAGAFILITALEDKNFFVSLDSKVAPANPLKPEQPPHVTGVEEIWLSQALLAGPRQRGWWEQLLGPAGAGDTIDTPGNPRIRFVDSTIPGIEAVVFGVKSLPDAKQCLEARGLTLRPEGDRFAIDADQILGLRILLQQQGATPR